MGQPCNPPPPPANTRTHISELKPEPHCMRRGVLMRGGGGAQDAAARGSIRGGTPSGPPTPPGCPPRHGSILPSCCPGRSQEGCPGPEGGAGEGGRRAPPAHAGRPGPWPCRDTRGPGLPEGTAPGHPRGRSHPPLERLWRGQGARTARIGPQSGARGLGGDTGKVVGGGY